MNRKFRGIWIPAALWLSKDLSLQKKCLIAEIDSFDSFWMSNRAIAEFLGVGRDRVKKLLAEMKNEGLIQVTTTRDPDTKQVVSRTIEISRALKEKIYIDDEYPREGDKNPPGVGDFNPRGEGDKNPPGVGDKSTHIEISIEKKEVEKKDKESIGEQVPQRAPKRQTTCRFVKPSIEEIRAYCTERGNSIDPDNFFDYYESKGWMIGKNHMKDWKAAVRTWERRDRERPAMRLTRRGTEQQRKEEAKNTVAELLAEFEQEERHG